MDTMKNYPKSQLWNPHLGIRFCLKPEAKPLYPRLDFARFFHAEATETTPIQEQQDQTLLQKPKVQFSEFISSLAAGRPIASNDGATLAKARSGTSTPMQVAQLLPPPPKTQLDFIMSESSFHDALNSAAKSAGSFWSHTLYESIQPDGANKRVKVHYCRSRHTMEHVCKKYFANEPVLGFDMEWVAYAKRDSGPRANVSLIQVASPSRIGLFHIAIFPKDDFVAPTFKSIMENADISKVGVNIQADCTRLRNQLGVETQGILELSHLYKVVKYSHDSTQQRLINKSCVSLAKQVQEVLCLPLYKEPSVRSSDWSRCLSEKQLTYAAADAYAGIQLYHVLETRRLQLEPVPDRPFHAELGLPIPILELPSAVGEDDFSSGTEILDSEDDSVSASDAESELAADTSMDEQTAAIPERDARILVAEGAAWTYRTNKKTAVLARPSALRAYYIWHNNEDLEPRDIAHLLRDPPLQTNTVVSYILDCLVKEKLPYDAARLTTELLDGSDYARSKYTALLETREGL